MSTEQQDVKQEPTPIPANVKPMVDAALESFAKQAQEPIKMAPLAEADQSLSFEERIAAFLAKRKGQKVRLNDFLKSLYGVPTIPGLKPEWHQGHEGKRLGRIIDKLVNDRVITPVNDLYKDLGTFYYEGDDPRTKYHNLNTVLIEVIVNS